MPMRPALRHRAAFTLIELIVTLVVVALLTAALAYTFGNVLTTAGQHSGTTLLAGVDASARQAASENQSGYQFPVIGADCATGTAGTTSLAAAGVTVTAGTSTGPSTVSACVNQASDTLYLAVVGQSGGCAVAVDTIVATALPPSVTNTTAPATTASTGDGPRYGTSSAGTCSAGNLYTWMSSGGQVSSTDPAHPSTVTLS